MRSSSASRISSRRWPDCSIRFRSLTGRHGSSGTSCVRPAPFLSKPFVDEDFAFFGKTLTGAPENRPRWKRGVEVVEKAMGEAVGKLYVAKHFPPEAKARMKELVANLIEAYRENITSLEWMSPETRKKALDKLAKFNPKIGYPDKWRDYSALEIRRATCWATSRGRRPLKSLAACQARQASRSRRMGHDAADRQRLLQPQHERDRVSRGDLAAAVLRHAGRRRRQLWGDRRGHRP